MVTISTRFGWVSIFFLATALFYAPLAYGCTRPEMLPTLYILMGGCIVAGLLSMAVRGARPKFPKVVLVCSTAVLVQGWWLVYHPVLKSLITQHGWLIRPTDLHIYQLSFANMQMATFLLLAFVVLCDLYTDPAMRRFAILAVAVSGVLNSLLGIIFKLTGDYFMLMFWNPFEFDWNNFAFYRYHGNAGAFLNLSWPIVLVFARRSWSAHNASIRSRTFWTVAAVLNGSALFFNASKAALAIGLLILPWPFATGLKKLQSKTLFIVVAVTLLLIAGLIFGSSQFAREAAFKRMTNSEEVSASFHGRATAYHQFFNAAPSVGAFGLGPGLFHVAFPYELSPLGNTEIGLREYAHEDFLQTALEWGWFGTFFWTLIIVGGLFRAVRTYMQRELFPSKTDRHLVIGAILGVLGTLAQASIDFPLQIPSIRLPFLVLLAFCWASPRLLTKPLPNPDIKHYPLPVPARFMKKAKAV